MGRPIAGCGFAIRCAADVQTASGRGIASQMVNNRPLSTVIATFTAANGPANQPFSTVNPSRSMDDTPIGANDILRYPHRDSLPEPRAGACRRWRHPPFRRPSIWAVSYCEVRHEAFSLDRSRARERGPGSRWMFDNRQPAQFRIAWRYRERRLWRGRSRPIR